MINQDSTYEFSPADWADLYQGSSREWIITNGLGSFASSTIIGANTRRYHGLFVAAMDPPVDRWVLLSKVEEELSCNGKTYLLSTNQYRDIVHPEGYKYLTRMAVYPFPTFLYHVNGIVIKKEIFMPYQKQITIIRYEVLRAPSPISLYLHLLVTARPFHNLLRANSRVFVVDGAPQKMTMRIRGKESPENVLSSKTKKLLESSGYAKNDFKQMPAGTYDMLWVASDRGYFYPDSQWYFNFQYPREKERGLDFEEDLYRPGCFTAKLREGESVTVAASIEPIEKLEPLMWQKDYLDRLNSIRKSVQIPHVTVANERQTILHQSKSDKFKLSYILETLTLAADTFVVNRSSEGTTSILAGYPWFSDWGRDTFISLTGLILVTGRYKDAKSIIRTFGQYCHKGLIPNSFLENSSRNPIYNSVDASLWFIYAIFEYWRYTNDVPFIREIFGLINSIIKSYESGTAYAIKTREDGLLCAGDPQVQLTWMDAKVGPWVVTPRHGAAVEINALWYNALKIAEILSEPAGLPPEELLLFSKKADKIKKTFLTYFKNSSEKCLYDCLGQQQDGSFEPDPSIRPNQIFAVSLPFPLVVREEAQNIVERVLRDLYTPYGLRTLASSNTNYKGQYQGDRWLRDGAYHQGTVWPWLMGPFITAYLNAYGRNSRSVAVAEELLAPIISHLWDSGVGTISEIFWGDFPHTPAGAISQAWSVGEILRVLVEEILGQKPLPQEVFRSKIN